MIKMCSGGREGGGGKGGRSAFRGPSGRGFYGIMECRLRRGGAPVGRGEGCTAQHSTVSVTGLEVLGMCNNDSMPRMEVHVKRFARSPRTPDVQAWPTLTAAVLSEAVVGTRRKEESTTATTTTNRSRRSDRVSARRKQFLLRDVARSTATLGFCECRDTRGHRRPQEASKTASGG